MHSLPTQQSPTQPASQPLQQAAVSRQRRWCVNVLPCLVASLPGWLVGWLAGWRQEVGGPVMCEDTSLVRRRVPSRVCSLLLLLLLLHLADS